MGTGFVLNENQNGGGSGMVGSCDRSASRQHTGPPTTQGSRHSAFLEAAKAHRLTGLLSGPARNTGQFTLICATSKRHRHGCGFVNRRNRSRRTREP